MTACLVSIIITSYNYGRYLADAIESSLEQSYQNVEVLVVDDGSTDNTKEVAKRYPIKYIFQKNQGVSVAKNNGIEQSKGEFFVCLDGDDKLYPNFVKKTLETITQDKRLGFVYVGTITWNEDTKIENLWMPRHLYSKYLLFSGWFGPLGPVLARRAAFNDVKYGFDRTLKVHEDLDLCFRILLKGWKSQLVFEPLHWYRIHGKSLNPKIHKENLSVTAPINRKYWFRKLIRRLNSLYKSSIGRIVVLIRNPVEYPEGVRRKLLFSHQVKYRLWNNPINRQTAVELFQEFSFTTDMLLEWSRNRQLHDYYTKQLGFLRSKLEKIISNDKHEESSSLLPFLVNPN